MPGLWGEGRGPPQTQEGHSLAQGRTAVSRQLGLEARGPNAMPRGGSYNGSQAASRVYRLASMLEALLHSLTCPHNPTRQERCYFPPSRVLRVQGLNPQPVPDSRLWATTPCGDRSADIHSPLQASLPFLLCKLGHDPHFPGWRKGKWEKTGQESVGPGWARLSS